MNRVWLIVGVCFCTPLGYGQDVLEDFALASQRDTVLAELVPGTDNYYDFHARHYQNLRDLKALAEVLKTWKGKLESSPLRDAIELREAILTGDADTLAKELDLTLEHTRPLAAGEKSRFPSVLDPVMVSEEAFLGEIEEANSRFPIKEFGTAESRRWLGETQWEKMTEDEQRALLEKVTRLDFPNLVPRLLLELKSSESRGFGRLPIHKNLLLSQLRELQQGMPKLMQNETFVHAWVKRLRPDGIDDAKVSAEEREAYLATLWEFVKDTPEVFSSLKAHVLYHTLVTQRELGKLDPATFDTYLNLPRSDTQPRAKHKVNLNEHFEKLTGFGIVGEDGDFLRDCLLELYAARHDIKKYEKLLGDFRLNPILAEAILTTGPVDEAAAAFSLLGAARHEALKNRVDIEFTPDNPTHFAPGDDVNLSVLVKNVREMTVRVFEVNALNYCRTNKRDITADIDLDGLRPGFEWVEKFDEAPIRQVRKTVSIPALKGKRGAWVVEFIGNGVSSRALVRKGALTYRVRPSVAGHIFNISDESGAPVETAAIYLGARKFSGQGEIVVPFSAAKTTAVFVLTDGKIASVERFKHETERPSLTCAIHLDAQSLIAGQMATVAVRPRFHVSEAPAALNLLKDAVLVIRATLSDGTTTTERIREFSLSHLGPTLHTFPVPTQLEKLDFWLEAEYEMLTTGEKKSLKSNAVSGSVNGIESSAEVAQIFWTRGKEGWRIEVRGRNGEPVANHELEIFFEHRFFKSQIAMTLASDENGRILIGEPKNIVWLRLIPFDPFGLDDDRAHVSGFSLLVQSDSGSTPLNHGEVWKSGQSIVMSWEKERDGIYQLVKMAGDVPVVDVTAKVKAKEGYVQIDGLEAGHYRMDFLRSGDRALEVVDEAVPYLQIPPLVMSTLEQSADGKMIVLQLRGNDAGTRVHVVARRYASDYQLSESFRHLGTDLQFYKGGTDRPMSLYFSGRVLGDEYRYILERRSEKKYPGNMLPRPGLLVNPWSDTGTKQDLERLSRQTASPVAAMRGRPKGDPSSSGDSFDGQFGNFASNAIFDFLSQGSVMLCNLKPDAEGRLEIPVADLGGNHLVEVFAENAHSWVSGELALPETELKRRDLRLLDKGLLEPEKRVAQRNTAAILKIGEALELGDALQAEFEVYDDLGKVFAFYGTLLKSDSEFMKFDFITRWPSFSEERKRELYSEFACHELNLFLKHKDPAFFEAVIRPWIANKYAPSFMDDYLLGKDLSGYTAPWRYDGLNAVERALLGHTGEVGRMESYLEANPLDKGAEDFLFSQALAAGALMDEMELGLYPDVADMDVGDPEASGRAYMPLKLEQTIIPQLDFNAVTLEEAVSELRRLSISHDPFETDPSKKGINLIIQDGGIDLGSSEITMRLSNVPFSEALKYVTELAGMRYRVEKYAVVITPQWATGSDMFTRTFRVAPDFLSMADDDGGAVDDPFGLSTESELRKKRSAREVLEENGVTLPEGASAVYDPRTSSLIVRNTQSNMELVEAYTASLCERAPADDPFSSADDPFAPMGGGAALKLRPAGREVAMRRNVRPFFEKMGKTRELAETYYYRVPMEQMDAGLMTSNLFWLDAAKAKGQPFLSPHFMMAANSRTEALLALALLDLPFKADEHAMETKDGALTMTAGSRAIALHRDFQAAAQLESPLLVGRTFYALDEPSEYRDGKQRTKSLKDGFLSGVAYGCRVVVSNSGENHESVNLLTQIPEGSLPLSGAKRTDSAPREIDPYGALQKEYAFYFPETGTFRCYPAQLSGSDGVLASTPAFTFEVKAVREGFDAKTWTDVAAYGSEEDVLTFLKSENLHRVELPLMLWRLSEKAFFENVVAVLTDRQYFDQRVFAYGFKHKHVAAMREYLLHEVQVLKSAGGVFDSELVKVRPQELGLWELLEYDPFVNARAWHDMESPWDRVLNPALKEQLKMFFGYLSHQPATAIDDDSRLAIVYYLLLQDRYEEGLVWFRRIDPDKVTTKIQMDYLRCWLAFLEEKPGDAEGIAKAYAAYPVDRWREKFEEVLAQAAEIRDAGVERTVKADDREQQLNRLADEEVVFDMKVEKRGLRVQGSNLKTVTFRYYEMDLEFLFSANPFVESDTGRFSFIAPNKTLEVNVEAGEKVLNVELPEEFQNRSVLVEAESGGKRVARAVYANRLDIAVSEGYGRLQVREAGTDKALSAVYVKVYVRGADGGKAVFFKDGYTDLRGKFEYASRSGDDVLTDGGEFAIFISSETHGAEIRMAPVPKM